MQASNRKPAPFWTVTVTFPNGDVACHTFPRRADASRFVRQHRRDPGIIGISVANDAEGHAGRRVRHEPGGGHCELKRNC